MRAVAIILTSYNKPDYVGKAIESVLNQTFKDWVLFVADDNSNEETKKVIYSYLTEPRITYFQSDIAEEERYALCRYAHLTNLGISHTSSKYLSYLSDDVVYHQNRLDIFVNYLEGNPNKDVCYGGQARFEVSPEGVKRSLTSNYFGEDTFGAACNIDHSSIMHRRDILEKTGYWPEGPEHWGNADAHFFRQITDTGRKFYWIEGFYDTQYVTPQSLHVDRGSGSKLYPGVPWDKEKWFE